MVRTNDPAQERIVLTIAGPVLRFATIAPTYVRLTGTAGDVIYKTVSITHEKQFPFQIVGVRARNGKDIAFDLKPHPDSEGDGYLLTIENKKTTVGRYSDTLILTTDSAIKSTLTIPVYGQISSPHPD